ncbi:LysM peptidoglycan-binding domain-containing M23 family metallopeptidase [Bradyrhizobium sp. 521_C7_N1_3]|uniref:LysM peptidoglycan-binding domain-containing M23 family metallopeptidase n=1 Tax=Bradyrhizobium sp. 521_C7_N1_3 TaxID=3240368 RepID=UPI003F8A88BA
MKVAQNSSLLRLALAILCVALAGIAVSDFLREHSRTVRKTQNHYIEGSGGGVADNVALDDQNLDEPASLRKLREANFFTDTVRESAAVQKVKPFLGAQYRDRYFGTLWDLLWYLDFMGTEPVFYTAVRSALTSGALKESNPICEKITDCEPVDKTVTLNNLNARTLFDILKRRYVDRAVRAYEDLALAEARQLVLDGMNLSRLFRISSDTDEATVGAYNELVVPLVFLSKYATTNSLPKSSDLRALTNPEDRNVDDILDGDIKTYYSALALMYEGCFSKSSVAFAQGAASANAGMVKELLSFMALRSLTTPFLAMHRRKHLQTDETKPDTVFVYDCEETIDASHFLKSYSDFGAALKQNITHPGLSADLEYYKTLVPISAGALASLRADLLKTHQQNATSNNGDKRIADDSAWSWDGGLAYVVKGDDTFDSISNKWSVPVQILKKLNGLSTDTTLVVGSHLIIPKRANKADQRSDTLGSPTQVSAKQSSGQSPEADPKQTDPPTRDDDEVDVAGMFRWPVRGKVVAAYHSKQANNKNNDGINLAVPEGTPVKAADDGTVAYSGSELKGYGNLVLVRHSNGFTTAYAHNSDLLVKRGDTVKRGQIIAKSGQSGEVSEPQLHFEIRKGSAPVDPVRYLN